jgi:6-phosphogluconolactonase
MSRRPGRWALRLALAAVLAAPVSGGGGTGVAPTPRAGEARTTRVYVGTYTGGASRGIYRLEFEPASGGWVSGPVLAAPSENPSFLALGPDGRFLYAVNELQAFQGGPTGAVSAFAVDAATGRLDLLNQQPSEGADPCHLVVDPAGRNVLVANYTSGTVAVLPASPDGRLRRASAVRRVTGSGPVRVRQQGPHAHMVVLDGAARFAIWTDLGADRVRIDRFDAAAGQLEPNDPEGVAIQPGSGPRHVAWHPSGRALYLLNELSSTVSALRFDAARGVLAVFQTLPARAEGAKGESLAAEIAVAPDGRFLYASNRGDDTIAVFAIDAATLSLSGAGHVPTGGRTPRSFAIDPSGRWLIAANQESSSLVVFRLDPVTGLPVAVGAPVTVPQPVCVLFVPANPKVREAPDPWLPTMRASPSRGPCSCPRRPAPRCSSSAACPASS